MLTGLQMSTFSDIQTLILLVFILFLRNFTFFMLELKLGLVFYLHWQAISS